MKKAFIFLGAVMVFALTALIITLTSSGGGTLTGTYALVDVSGSNSEMFKATVGDAALEIDDDNTGNFSMLDQTTDVAVKPDESKISFDGGKTYSSYTLDGGKLTIENNGYKAVFKKK